MRIPYSESFQGSPSNSIRPEEIRVSLEKCKLNEPQELNEKFFKGKRNRKGGIHGKEMPLTALRGKNWED